MITTYTHSNTHFYLLNAYQQYMKGFRAKCPSGQAKSRTFLSLPHCLCPSLFVFLSFPPSHNLYILFSRSHLPFLSSSPPHLPPPLFLSPTLPLTLLSLACTPNCILVKKKKVKRFWEGLVKPPSQEGKKTLRLK